MKGAGGREEGWKWSGVLEGEQKQETSSWQQCHKSWIKTNLSEHETIMGREKMYLPPKKMYNIKKPNKETWKSNNNNSRSQTKTNKNYSFMWGEGGRGRGRDTDREAMRGSEKSGGKKNKKRRDLNEVKETKKRQLKKISKATTITATISTTKKSKKRKNAKNMRKKIIRARNDPSQCHTTPNHTRDKSFRTPYEQTSLGKKKEKKKRKENKNLKERQVHMTPQVHSVPNGKGNICCSCCIDGDSVRCCTESTSGAKDDGSGKEVGLKVAVEAGGLDKEKRCGILNRRVRL